MSKPAIHATPLQQKRRKGVFYELFIKHPILTLMIAPAVLYIFVFSYLPMLGIVIAFKDYTYAKGIFGSDWAGFKNFKFLFQTGVIYRVTINTILYNLAFLTVDIVAQMTIAVFLSELTNKYFKKITQTMLLLPFFISWVVAGAIVFNILSYRYGVINNVLTSLGLEKVDIMNNPTIWPPIIVFFRMWKGIGYGSIVYLANIMGIDQEIYEAAKIDGASIFQRVKYITLPLLKPTIVILILLSLGNIIRGDFAMFYNLTGNNALLLDVTDIIDTFVYRSLMTMQNYSMSTAAGLYQSVLGFFIIVTVNTIIKKVQPDYTLF
ncbi:MAG: ABC transporter permease [Caldicoprobacterales bacterium]|jgi:putative aldouronate transport system permease protein|nr:sugar ABC transporter permease [Clostridiales bacterium]